MKIIELTGKVSSDHTGSFPIMYSKGKKYFTVVYDHDTNAILVEPLKSHSQKKILNAQIKLHDYLTDRGFTLRVQIRDNEFLEALKHHFRGREMIFQLAPPNIHLTNAS